MGWIWCLPPSTFSYGEKLWKPFMIISQITSNGPQTAYGHTQVATAVSDLYFCCLNQHILILHEGRMFSHTKSYMIMYLQYQVNTNLFSMTNLKLGLPVIASVYLRSIAVQSTIADWSFLFIIFYFIFWSNIQQPFSTKYIQVCILY